jgi:hypothetical protein
MSQEYTQLEPWWKEEGLRELESAHRRGETPIGDKELPDMDMDTKKEYELQLFFSGEPLCEKTVLVGNGCLVYTARAMDENGEDIHEDPLLNREDFRCFREQMEMQGKGILEQQVEWFLCDSPVLVGSPGDHTKETQENLVVRGQYTQITEKDGHSISARLLVDGMSNCPVIKASLTSLLGNPMRIPQEHRRYGKITNWPDDGDIEEAGYHLTIPGKRTDNQAEATLHDWTNYLQRCIAAAD